MNNSVKKEVLLVLLLQTTALTSYRKYYREDSRCSEHTDLQLLWRFFFPWNTRWDAADTEISHPLHSNPHPPTHTHPHTSCWESRAMKSSLFYAERVRITRTTRTNARPRSSLLAEPLWTDPCPKERNWCKRADLHFKKKKEKKRSAVGFEASPQLLACAPKATKVLHYSFSCFTRFQLVNLCRSRFPDRSFNLILSQSLSITRHKLCNWLGVKYQCSRLQCLTSKTVRLAQWWEKGVVIQLVTVDCESTGGYFRECTLQIWLILCF